MRKARVITNYTDESDNILDYKASCVVDGCTDNDDFNFTKGELINLKIGLLYYRDKLSRSTHGSRKDVTLKNEAKKALAALLKVICQEINHQHKGDEAILLGSGAVLAKNSNTHKQGLYPFVENFRLSVGLGTDELKVRVKKIKGLNNYGTVFAFIESQYADNDIITWNMEHSTCHSATLTGLKRAKAYQVSAAYKGSKGTRLNWCPPITITTKAG